MIDNAPEDKKEKFQEMLNNITMLQKLKMVQIM